MTGVRIEITAHDGTRQVFETVEGRLKGMADQGKATVSSFDRIGQGAARMSSAISHVIGISNSFEIRQVRLEQATERLRAAQEAETQAVIEYGPASEQAASATRQREAAEAALEKTVRSSNIATAASVAQIVSLTAQAPAAARALHGIAAGALTAAAGMSALQIAATGGLAAITIIGGYVALETVLRGTGTAADDTKGRLKELEEQIAAAERATPQLGAGPGLRTILDEFDITGELHKKKQEYEQLKAARAKLLEDAKKADMERAAAFAESVRFEENVRAAKLVGDKAFFAAEFAQVRESVLAKKALLSSPLEDVNQRGEEEKEYNLLEARQTLLERALTDITETETRRRADAWKKEMDARRQAGEAFASSLEAGLGRAGVTLDRFTLDFQDRLRRSVGMDPAFAANLLAASKAEQRLTEEALKSSKALRDQATITAHKDETTQEFVQRLKDFGFTEDEVRRRVDETGRSLRSQADATRAASTATAGMASSAFGGNLAGAGSARVERAGTSTGAASGEGTMEELQLAIARAPGALNNPAVQAYFGSLRALMGGAQFHGGTLNIQRATALAALNEIEKSLAAPWRFEGPAQARVHIGEVGLATSREHDVPRNKDGVPMWTPPISAAGGFEGRLTRDQLFQAHAGEDVFIGRRSSSQAPVVYLTQEFYGPVNPEQVRQATEEGLRSALSPGETRLATRRTI